MEETRGQVQIQVQGGGSSWNSHTLSEPATPQHCAVFTNSEDPKPFHLGGSMEVLLCRQG